MKTTHYFLSILFILTISSSSTSFSQSQDKTVSVTEQKINDKTIYTFVDQRNIPDEKTSAFSNRISNLYPIVEKITFEKTQRTFSIYFVTHPNKEELKSVFGHFNVYKYTLN